MFAPEREHLLLSRDLLRKWWDTERESRGMVGIDEALDVRLRAGQSANEHEALTLRTEQERRREEAGRE